MVPALSNSTIHVSFEGNRKLFGQSRIKIDGLNGSIRHHNFLTALVARIFGSGIDTIKDSQNNIYYVNKESFNKWRNSQPSSPLLSGSTNSIIHELLRSRSQLSYSPLSLSSAASAAASETNRGINAMLKNTEKAVKERVEEESVWMPHSKAIPTFESLSNSQSDLLAPLNYTQHTSEAQSRRSTMEDEHFYTAIEGGIIMGVLDGHGGKAVATLVKNVFPKVFEEQLRILNGNVKSAFENSISKIHSETILTNDSLDEIGSTAVLCYIDTRTQLIYTATLADSEAMIHRKHEGSYKAIPLSLLRDWNSTSAEKFVRRIDENILSDMDKQNKKVRLCGINVCRAFGDAGIQINDQPIISQKPKVTIQKLLPNDRLILCCDGLMDYATKKDIQELVNQNLSAADLSKALVDLSLRGQSIRKYDNVTVMVVDIAAA